MAAPNIPEHGVDADELLLSACSTTLRRLGAEVRIRAGGENLVRALRPDPPFAPRGPAPWTGPPNARVPAEGGPAAVIEAAGLPNLLHEFVHVALAGCLTDDHGIDYQAIPYDLDTAAGRAVLWDEVAACVVSCGYLLGASTGMGAWVRVDGWFDEQLGIQPVFYGMDDEPSKFWSELPRVVGAHRAECDAMTACAHDRVALLLQWGAQHHATPTRLDFDALWIRRGLT